MHSSLTRHTSRMCRIAMCLEYSSFRSIQRRTPMPSRPSHSSLQFLAVDPQHLLYHRCLSNKRKVSKVPDKPVTINDTNKVLPEVPEIDLALVEQLERVSLVEFANEKGLQELRNAVKSANQLLLIDTDGVEPLDSVLEDRPLWLRDDEVVEGNCVEEILSNATKTEEQYFVAPPGNIPLKKKDREHFSNFLEKEVKMEPDT